MNTRYLLCPGQIKSRNDGQWHFISAVKLARLYGVSFLECAVMPAEGPLVRVYMRDEEEGKYVRLTPRSDGKYILPPLVPSKGNKTMKATYIANLLGAASRMWVRSNGGESLVPSTKELEAGSAVNALFQLLEKSSPICKEVKLLRFSNPWTHMLLKVEANGADVNVHINVDLSGLYVEAKSMACDSIVLEQVKEAVESWLRTTVQLKDFPGTVGD